MWTIRLSNCTKNRWLNWSTAFDFFVIYLFIATIKWNCPQQTPTNAQRMHSVYVCVCELFHSYFVWIQTDVLANIKWLGVWVAFALRRSINVSVRFDQFSSIWFLQISKSAFKLTIVHRLKLQLCMVASVQSKHFSVRAHDAHGMAQIVCSSVRVRMPCKTPSNLR